MTKTSKETKIPESAGHGGGRNSSPASPVIPIITVTEAPDEPVAVHVPVQAHERVRPRSIESLEELDGVRIILHRASASTSIDSHDSGGSGGHETLGLRKESGGAATSSHGAHQQKPPRRRKRCVKVIKWRRQLYTIFWTNLLMRYRMKIVSFFELLLPVLIIWICIAALTSTHRWSALQRVKKDLDPAVAAATSAKNQLPISETKIQSYFCKSDRLCSHRKVYIVFAPDTNFTQELMKTVVTKLLKRAPPGVDTLLAVDSPSELVTLCRTQYAKSANDPEVPDPVGIVFSTDNIHPPPQGLKLTPGGIPTALHYTIRTFSQEISNTLDLFPYLDIPNEDGISPYITSGFMGLQAAIDTSYTEMLATEMGDVPLVDLTIAKPSVLVHLSQEVRLQMFPFTIYLDLKVRQSTWAVIMISIILGYFCTTYFTLNRLILHRSAGILKMLKLHGMSSTIHWLSLLFYEILFHFITCIGITIVLFAHVAHEGGLLEYDDPGLVFFFLYVHGLAANCFCLLISAFFTKTVLGSLIGYVISFLSFFIPMNLYLYGYIHHWLLNLFLCLLFPNWTLANGIYQFLKFESYDSGVNWPSSTTWTDDARILFPIGWCLPIFFISSFMYFCLTLIWDHHINLKNRCTHCLCFWKKNARTRKYSTDSQMEESFEKPAVYEEDELHACNVMLRNVTVVFGKDTIALDDVSMNFHEGQLTVLLGLNHAGKSTLLNVIAGVIKPNSGTVLVYGKDPYRTSDRLSNKIGFCPRKLHLFPSLSVEEHIRLCCMLHGNSIRNSKATSTALLKTFKLWDARNMGVKYITPTQLRKLGLAMAMSNNCAVLVLEEPTYQMSDTERHEIWSSLQYLKKNRTVIVSLGSLDDGDAYADRLILMSKGKVVCAGSPSFLNQSYNIGTFIKVRKEVEDVNVDQITFFIQILFPGLVSAEEFHEVKLTGNEEQEHYMYLSIPRDLKFSKVLSTLEMYKNELGIADVHVLNNTLAGIFYKLSNSAAPGATARVSTGGTTLTTSGGVMDQNQVGIFRRKRDSTDFSSGKQEPSTTIEIPTLPEGVHPTPKWHRRLQALIIRHFQYSCQKQWYFFGEFVASFILIAVFMLFCESYLHPQPASTARLLSFSTYPKSRVPVHLLIRPDDETPAWMNAFRRAADADSSRLMFYNNSKEDQEAFMAHQQPSAQARTSYQSQISTAFQASFTHDDNIGYYASNARHAAPISLNTFKNVILYLLTPATLRNAGLSYHVTASNHPFVLHNGTGTPLGTVNDVTNALAGVIFSFILVLIAGSRLMLPHLERRSGLKYLMKMAGVSGLEYWSATWICDLAIGIIGSCCLIALVWLTDINGVFAGVETKVLIFLLCFLYLCWSSLPFAYVFSAVITNPNSGYGQFIMFHILTGSLPILVTYLIYDTEASGGGQKGGGGVYFYIRYIFQVFPSFTISSAFVLLCEHVAERHFCDRMPEESKQNCKVYEDSTHHKHYNQSSSVDQNDIYFQKCCTAFCADPTAPTNTCLIPPDYLAHEDGAFDIWLNVICMVGQGFGYWLLLLIVELSIWSWIRGLCQNSVRRDLEVTRALQVKHHAKKDPDVLREEKRVTNTIDAGVTATDCLLVSDLTKINGFKKVLDHVYFKMIAGTIMGLLGPAESGKSEVVKALTGTLRYTHGTCILNRISKARHKRKFLRQIGYSPEKPALLPYLTGLQLMQLMGRLRGIPSKYLTIHAKKWLSLLAISDATQVLQSRFYNNGRQKRLSFGMALIGQPYLLVFDEPTELLDENEAIIFWNLLTFLRKQGQSILFTSSSAEECSQTCSKLVCFVNGAVSAVGVPQRIFARYPRGWSLLIRLYHDIGVKFSKPDVEHMTQELVKYILRVFQPCELTDQREHLLFFYVEDKKADVPMEATTGEEETQAPQGTAQARTPSRNLSFMYGQMEEVKEGMPEFIDEYFIEEASLDDMLATPPPPLPTGQPA